ncbi:type II secretion system protein N [Thermodesulfobacteriota bacterium]
MKKLYYTIFNLLALSSIIYIGIDSFYRILRVQLRQFNIETISVQDISDNARRVRPRLTDFQTIINRDIFKSQKAPPVNEDKQKTEVLEPTSLKIALSGTIAGNRENAAAIIEETNKKKQGLYRVGDSVQNAVIKEILRGKVVLRVRDKDEILLMDESPTSKTENANRPEKITAPAINTRTITVSRSSLQSSFEDINALLSQATIRPHFKDGQADGLAITGIKAGSVFRRMGLRNGDIVYGIKGNPIQTPDDLISLYNSMLSESNISLQLRRRGQERVINYRFRD